MTSDKHQRPLSAEAIKVLCSAIESETGCRYDVDGLDVPFDDLALDALSIMHVLEEVQDRAGIELPAAVFRDCANLAELVNKLGGAANGASSTPLGGQQLVRSAFASTNQLLAPIEDEAGCSNFWTDVHPDQMRLVRAYINESFARLGASLIDMAPGTPLSHPPAVLAKHHRVLDGAIYDILRDGGLIERRQGDGRYIRTARPVDPTPSETLYKSLLRDHPQHANTHRLLNATGAQFAECLTGQADPIKILFGKPVNKELLQDFYTNAPMSVAASKLLVATLRTVFSQITQAQSRPVEILEVGAGMGGTTKFVLDMLVEARIPFRYVFTDISASFFPSAKKRFQPYVDAAAGGSAVDYVVLDIEQTPPPGHLQSRFDAVISTNCIHATRDLVVSCSNARRLLRPGGFFALVEFTTRLYWLDLVFGLLDGWWLFEDGRTHCTADEMAWKKKLDASGFDHLLWVEDGGRKPNPQLMIACTAD